MDPGHDFDPFCTWNHRKWMPESSKQTTFDFCSDSFDRIAWNVCVYCFHKLFPITFIHSRESTASFLMVLHHPSRKYSKQKSTRSEKVIKIAKNCWKRKNKCETVMKKCKKVWKVLTNHQICEKCEHMQNTCKQQNSKI